MFKEKKMRTEILDYYSEKSKKVIFSQYYLAISLVSACFIAVFPAWHAVWPQMHFLADSHFLWKTYGSVNHYLIEP